MLSDSDSDGEELQITINEHFAKAYAKKKEREELSKLKEKYGSDAEEDDEEEEDSEEDVTEDEDGEELTPAVDVAILRTLARIKRKDPSIYDYSKDVFEEEQLKTKEPEFARKSSKDKHKSKPLLMRQHVLNSALKSTSRSPSPEPALPTHTEEQAALRNETISAFHEAVEEDADSDGDDLLIPREKTQDELEREAEEYRDFLAREVGEDIGSLVTVEERADGVDERADKKDVPKAEVQGKKKKKGKERKEESDHEFLMNYILNRGWIDKSERHVPTYGEIVGKAKGKESKKSKGGEEGDDAAPTGSVNGNANSGEGAFDELDDVEFEEVAETFESSYNFRFEEPDAATIPSHPRNIASAVRREDTSRKEARERRNARKEEELLKKKEEIKRLKALKLKELRAKLERIGKEGGVDADDEALAQLDLDADWDPDKHDQQMAEIYAGAGEDGVDGEGEGDEEDADEKPTWADDIDIADILPEASSSKSKSKKKKKHTAEDPDEGVDISDMDADAPPVHKKRKLDPALEGALDALDFSGLTAGLPTRFKYVPVLPESFGLTPEEILLADDADLNSYVGLKKLAPYRKDAGKKMTWVQGRDEKLRELRQKIAERRRAVGGGEGGDGGGGPGVYDEEGERKKKRKGKKERMKERMAVVVNEDGEGVEEAGGGADVEAAPQALSEQVNGGVAEGTSKKRKRRHKRASAHADGGES